MSALGPLPCCPEAGGLCKSCQDYRGYMHDTRYKDDVEIYRPPEGFQHMTWKMLKGEAAPGADRRPRRRGIPET